MHADEAGEDAFWGRLAALLSVAEDHEERARLDADYPEIRRWSAVTRDIRAVIDRR